MCKRVLALVLICGMGTRASSDMIANKAGSIVISSIGWVDHGSLWVFSVPTAEVKLVSVSDARSVGLFLGADDHFAVQHTWGEEWHKIDRIELTAHSFGSPQTVLAKIILTPGHSTAEGDFGIWRHLPHVYLGPLSGHYYLFHIDAARGTVRRQPLTWFEKQYDPDYQGIGPAIAVPRSNFILLPIQRSSKPMLYDLVAAKAIREIDLGAAQYKPGKPHLAFSSDGKILWALDYDTLVQLDRSSWKIMSRLRLQEGDSEASSKFVGSLSLALGGKLCVVPRPFSSDIAIIDSATQSLITHVTVGGQPLEALLLDKGKIVARDWHTGQLLTGSYPSQH